MIVISNNIGKLNYAEIKPRVTKIQRRRRGGSADEEIITAITHYDHRKAIGLIRPTERLATQEVAQSAQGRSKGIRFRISKRSEFI